MSDLLTLKDLTWESLPCQTPACMGTNGMMSTPAGLLRRDARDDDDATTPTDDENDFDEIATILYMYIYCFAISPF